ncbi:MAG TPA: SprT family zinc-dependent metalloprotease [Candidatus Sulfopaludibacter sp.]|nr:SprT family zinc-dependent metalloprotease [Candidatus Sulfopaludibacter sp.]
MTFLPIQKHKIVYKNNEIEFQIIKTARKKTSEITVKYDDILIRAPFSKSIEDIESLVNSKVEWILQKIKENSGKKPEIIFPTYKNNTTLPYLGKNVSLKIVKDKNDYLEFSNNEFVMHVNKNKVKTIYEKWLFNISSIIFNQFIEKYSILLNIRPKKILIKNLKSRWGSATYKGTINLNVNLIKAPIEVIEYVVLHEMSHLIEKNHSHRFWKIIEYHMSNYPDKIKWLKINGSNIL